LSACDHKITDITQAIELTTEDFDAAAVTITKLDKAIKSVSKKTIDKNLDKLIKIRDETNSLKQQLDAMRNQVNPFLEPLQELQDMDIGNDVDRGEIDKLTRILDHQKFLHKLLTKKDSFVRKTLLNKNIPFLNKRLNHYLGELGLPHKVEFTYELTAEISQFGRTMDFGNLSNGQRSRVNLALSLSFRDVLQNLHDHINVCMFDEVLDVGLDTVGVQLAAKMIKRKAREEKLCAFIISHRDEIDNAFDRTITVEMSKGFSYIVEGNSTK
jgi:DNA repair exonuclease SbcCD ATPase subunit